MINRDLTTVSVLKIALIFFLVEKEIILGGIVWPDILYALIYFSVVFKFFKILNYLERRSGTCGIVD